jgi:acetyl esterase
MNKKFIFIILVASFFIRYSCFSQEQILYKQIDTAKLFMEVYSPEKLDATEQYPAMVFFFGGGWSKGSIKQFEPHAKYFAKRGLVCFLVDYRVTKRHQSTPFESLKDAKSAIRYIREHADKFNIDTSKIIASGGSAGGHLAAAAALVNEYNDDSDNLSISSKPNALILFNPAIDNGPGGVGYKRIGEARRKYNYKYITTVF